MQFQIPDEVIQKTTDCPCEFSCLETGKCGDKDLCTVRLNMKSGVLVLVSEDHADCPYRKPFGRLQTCQCPTRSAIFSKYEHDPEPSRRVEEIRMSIISSIKVATQEHGPGGHRMWMIGTTEDPEELQRNHPIDITHVWNAETAKAASSIRDHFAAKDMHLAHDRIQPGKYVYIR